MNLYLITFQSSLNRIESVYDCHKDLFVEIEKFFTLHLVPYTCLLYTSDAADE